MITMMMTILENYECLVDLMRMRGQDKPRFAVLVERWWWPCINTNHNPRVASLPDVDPPFYRKFADCDIIHHMINYDNSQSVIKKNFVVGGKLLLV